jgi:transcriptional regulator with XRE-family HTH domain
LACALIHRPGAGPVAKNAIYRRVTPDDIKLLRKELGCTARDLATTLGIEQKEVLAWEAGQLFPTKRFVDQMRALREKGPSAVLKTTKGKAVAPTDRVSDPAFWAIVKKLLLHPPLYEQVSKLAETYGDEKKG